MNCSNEPVAGFRVPGCNPTPSLENQESIFDQMTNPIEILIVSPLLLSVLLGRDDNFHPSGNSVSNDFIRVIAAVCQQRFSGYSLNQMDSLLLESRAQEKVVANAARYLTNAAKTSSVAYASSDNRRTYNQSSNVTLTGNTFQVRDDKDIQALAIEIASLTRRQHQARGLRRA